MSDFANDAAVKKDRLRYTKNKMSANLALLAIVFDALFFANVYRSDVGTYYYTWLIGISIVYNLLFMLSAFLAEEGVKGYKMGYGVLLILLGIGQIIRIFIIPMQAKNATVVLTGEVEAVMENSQFIRQCVYLIASSACCIASGIIAVIKSKTLETYLAELAKKEEGSAAV